FRPGGFLANFNCIARPQSPPGPASVTPSKSSGFGGYRGSGKGTGKGAGGNPARPLILPALTRARPPPPRRPHDPPSPAAKRGACQTFDREGGTCPVPRRKAVGGRPHRPSAPYGLPSLAGSASALPEVTRKRLPRPGSCSTRARC